MGYAKVKTLDLRCLIKVAIVDAVESDLRWISKLFQIVGATNLKARREMLVGAKLLSGIYSKSIPDDPR